MSRAAAMSRAQTAVLAVVLGIGVLNLMAVTFALVVVSVKFTRDIVRLDNQVRELTSVLNQSLQEASSSSKMRLETLNLILTEKSSFTEKRLDTINLTLTEKSLSTDRRLETLNLTLNEKSASTEKRLDTINLTLDSTEKSLETLNLTLTEKSASTERRLETLNLTLDSTEKSLETLNLTLDSTERRLDTLNLTLTEKSAFTEMRLETLNLTLDSTEKLLETLNLTSYTKTRLETLNLTLDSTERRLDTLNLTLDSTEKSLKTLNLTLGYTEKRLETLNLTWTEKSAFTEKRLDTLNLTLDSTEKSLETLNLTLDSTERRLDTLILTLDSTEKHLETLTSSVDVKFDSLNSSFTTSLHALSSSQTALASRQDVLERSSVPLASCQQYKDNGVKRSGVYFLYLQDGGSPFPVYCDMQSDDFGWVVFQRRVDGSEDFYRTWADYKAGFGRLEAEFWLGNDKLHRLTSAGLTRLRVDLGDFENNTAYALYSSFSVAGEGDNYSLRVSGYSGTAGELLFFNNFDNFSTKDRENDHWFEGNCAVEHSGAWWYFSCTNINLNGLYNTTTGDERGIFWDAWKGRAPLKSTEMKVR